MAIYYSPDGNPEVWDEGAQPADYMTPDEWLAAHPAPQPNPPSPEQAAAMQHAAALRTLAQLDAASIRALRAVLLDMVNGVTPSGEDLARLALDEAEVIRLREDLALESGTAAG